MSAILEFFSPGCYFDHIAQYSASGYQISSESDNLLQTMTSYTISRWRQRWLNTTSGFVFEGQNLSANQISSTYLNPRLRYNYFRFGKTNFRHKISPLRFWPDGSRHCVLFWMKFPNRTIRGRVKMAPAVALQYFRFRI